MLQDDFTQSWWPIVISFFISCIVLIRLYAAGPKCPSENRLDGRVVLITGASGGIGLATVKELCQRGGTVILTCRDKARGIEAVDEVKLVVPDAKVELEMLDVSSMSQIERFVSELHKRHRKVDVLINNAAVILRKYERTSENLERTFATNYLGPFLLSHLLLPLLLKSDDGRIINVVSPSHYAAEFDVGNINFVGAFEPSEAHGQTKLQLVMFTQHMAKLLQGTTVTINAVNPGLVRGTKHLESSTLMSSPLTKVSVYPWVWLFLKTPKQGSQSVVYAAVDSALNKTTGKYISDCELKEASEKANDVDSQKNLYERSCQLCRLDVDYVHKLIDES